VVRSVAPEEFLLVHRPSVKDRVKVLLAVRAVSVLRVLSVVPSAESVPRDKVPRIRVVLLSDRALLVVPPTLADLAHSVASVKLLVLLLHPPHPPSPPRTRVSRPPTRTSQRRSLPRTLPMLRTRSGSRLRRRHG
jgi:hypothetical protein